MPEPCQGCAFKDVDFGGCRCQAFQITGDAAATDPACVLSPMHHLMSELTAAPAALRRTASSEVKVRILGTAAGGGLPQWNCGCRGCQTARTGGGGRTQDCLAISW